jgi:hypothetical protein
LAADLARRRDTGRHVQSSRDRNAIILFLTHVFELVAWWTFENQANERAARALTLKEIAVAKKLSHTGPVSSQAWALKNRQTSGEQMVKSITVCGGAKTFQKTAAAIYQKPGRD